MKEFILETKSEMKLVGVLVVTNNQLNILPEQELENAINTILENLTMELRVKCSYGDITPINPFNTDESIKVSISTNGMTVKFLKEEVTAVVIENN